MVINRIYIYFLTVLKFNFFFSIKKLLSRTKAADDPAKQREIQEKHRKKLPELEDFLMKRDFSGAIALLEVKN